MNKIFNRGPNPQHNACVGNNGQADAADYSNGYSTASRLLIEAYMSNSINVIKDQLVYPICFNMRHSIEINLKTQTLEIEKINALRECKSRLDNLKSHDINITWQYLSEYAKKADRRFNPLIERLSPLIEELGSIDPTGQTFRYPENVDGHRHLIQVSIINIERLEKSFSYIEKYLKELSDLVIKVLREYNTGTHTKSLSRYDIYEISKLLPNRSSWSNSNFKDIRERIKHRYNLSGREFSLCINHIEDHYEFSANIGLPKKIEFISVNDIKNLNLSWKCLHPNFNRTYSSRILTLGDLHEEAKKPNDIKTYSLTTRGLLTEPQVSTIEALFYFGYNPEYSEDYLEKLCKTRKENQARMKSEDNLLENSLQHVIEKTNALTNITRSLSFLEQHHLLPASD